MSRIRFFNTYFCHRCRQKVKRVPTYSYRQCVHHVCLQQLTVAGHGVASDSPPTADWAMEPKEAAAGQNSAARRSLRAGRTPVSGSAPAAPPPPASGSPRSDASGSRSSRLNNPEFAAKHKAFMAKVTAATKGSMDTYLTTSETTAVEAAVAGSSAPGGGNKRRLSSRTDDVKRRRSMRTNSSGLDVQSDGYCWICHKVLLSVPALKG